MVSQSQALERALGALTLDDGHAALVAVAEGLAVQLDESDHDSTRCKSCGRVGSDAPLWREYRQVLELLLTLGVAEEDDGQAAFLELVRTPVGDAKKSRPRKSRAGGGGDREPARAAVDAVAAAGRGRRSGTSA